jgi:hypothetical protein
MFATEVGNKTVPNLNQVKRRLMTFFFAPHEVLGGQAKCMGFNMRKPKDVSTRQCSGTAATLNDTLNDTLVKLPPADIMASKAPKTHKRSS